MDSFNIPEHLREIRELMEAKLGPEVTKRSLGRMLNDESFNVLYSHVGHASGCNYGGDEHWKKSDNPEDCDCGWEPE